MRRAGRIVAAILEEMRRSVRPGMATKEFESIAVRELGRHGAASSFIGYRGYPAHVCVSVNDELVHGIPGDNILREGDIVSLDFAAIVDGFHADATVTAGVGEISAQAKALLETTEGSLGVGIARARRGAHLSDISAAVQAFVEARGFSVVREYVGHGIGRKMHEEPQIPNFGPPGQGTLLRKGMALALEPMVTAGDWRTKVGGDGWTVSTRDGSLCAHFEHTIAITDGDAEILTILD